MIKRCPTCGYRNPADAIFCTNPDATCGVSLAHVDAVQADEATAESANPPSPIAPSEAAVMCTDPECGQANPPGVERCQYCNSPLVRAPSIPGARTGVRFPWGFEPLEEALRIGRSPSFSLLARKLHPRYDNVSNRHAELRVEADRIVLVDLGSSNGTFVNDRRIGQNAPVEVRAGDRLRFAADLEATIEASDG